ncbi:MAG TPA: alpha/beta fold hydrolase [Chryseolinea sp.]|nr:alpha/beta fold hydrolase [Chryseolinea sp.]
MRNSQDWINKELYPFQSHFLTIDNNQLHYIDEGAGTPLLFVHGTPEWSFGYRDVIKQLRRSFRCVAIDLLGFGLSDKPNGTDYTCAGHSRRLTKFIEHLDLKNFSVVANDFGGSISLRYVLDHPNNVHKIVLFNTWMRSLKNDKHYSGPAKILNSWLGRFLYLYMNTPVNTIMPAAYGDKRKLSPEIHRHYKAALPRGKRIAAYAFALELSNANEWWQNLWERLHTLSPNKFLFFWGMKDKFIQPYELENWKSRLPGIRCIMFEDAGHFVQEEKPDEMSKAIEEFIKVG